jgi:predicted RNA-binding Zn-ribbon protein involved in translation (DUF1610 family)
MESVRVRVRLAGRRIYEQPVSLSRAQPPKIGDLINLSHSGHMVLAQVTSTSSPICRESDLVTYLVYADELDRKEGSVRAGSAMSAHCPKCGSQAARLLGMSAAGAAEYSCLGCGALIPSVPQISPERLTRILDRHVVPHQVQNWEAEAAKIARLRALRQAQAVGHSPGGRPKRARLEAKKSPAG